MVLMEKSMPESSKLKVQAYKVSSDRLELKISMTFQLPQLWLDRDRLTAVELQNILKEELGRKASPIFTRFWKTLHKRLTASLYTKNK